MIWLQRAIVLFGSTILLLTIYNSYIRQANNLFTITTRVDSQKLEKYLTVPFTDGRLGNQLYHLISGLCIAKQLNRKFYVPYGANEMDLRDSRMEQVNLIFPRFQYAYTLMAPAHEQSVANASTSFDFVDPLRYINESARFLKMNILYGQHWNYFRNCETETRQFLTFADSVTEFGEQVKKTKKLLVDPVYTCAHIRRTDFKNYRIESTLPRTIALLKFVISQTRSHRVALFGDDRKFMRQVVSDLESDKRIEKGASYVSTYSEATDFYIASEICGSFIITSPVSSFGFWLAYMTKNQDNVYYYFTDGIVLRKKLEKSKFPSSWTALRVFNTTVVSQA